LKNVRFLSDLRASGAIPSLNFSFTYQLDNFREMRAFVEFVQEMNGDFAIFERLLNVTFTHEEYRRKAVHYPDHPLYEEFLDVIRDPIFCTWGVWHDFEYPGVENLAVDAAKRRLGWGKNRRCVLPLAQRGSEAAVASENSIRRSSDRDRIRNMIAVDG